MNSDEKHREELIETSLREMSEDQSLGFSILICYWVDGRLSFHTAAKGKLFQQVAAKVLEAIKGFLMRGDNDVSTKH